ncbi:NAD kinase [Flavobacteriaceae bacterium AU392]|nr:NAD kinase [Flavobacteriaceae bacterium]RKM81611.1 NAD kinase [Flavobacteriaceae bacterium AU392]
MKLAIFGQYFNENSKATIKTLLDILKEKNISIFVEDSYFYSIKKESGYKFSKTNIQTFKVLDSSFDLLISIGGDGTILRTITYIRDLSIPVIGINTGRLGFLATIQENNIRQAIDAILNKNYKISERTLLSVSTSPENTDILDFNVALNEITVSRKNTTSMITIETSLNNEYLTSYWADGLIISTPTGSTGYSLSCGGPVIMPDSENFVLTPIAPHNLNARPLIIPDITEIKLKVTGRETNHLVSLDSRIATLDNETNITIKKAPFKIRMIELNNESFLKTLRKKLLWGEDKRN